MIQLHKLLKYHKKIEYTSNIFGISRPEIVFYKKEGSKTKILYVPQDCFIMNQCIVLTNIAGKNIYL